MKQAYTSMTCPKFIGYIYTIWNLVKWRNILEAFSKD
jgi:hypothetical protein